MVCSSTLRAMAVIHSAKRRKPRRVKAQAKEPRRSCQTDQSNVACDMARPLYGAKWGLPPGRFRPGDVAFNTIYLYRLCGEIRGNYCLIGPVRFDERGVETGHGEASEAPADERAGNG